MIQEYRPDYVAVAFDVGRTFRDDLFAAYKAGRAETPAELPPQLERITQILTALNIPIYRAEGYEADDVIGTLAAQATAHGLDTLILTGDTDTLQLVDDHVHVLLANPSGHKTTTTVYDPHKVRERYKGLAPSQLADLRGLKGDPSDNIPGVGGIGEVGAITLLTQFGTVEAIYDHIAEVPKRYRKHLEGQREQALLSKRLAMIVRDVPVQFDPSRAIIHEYDRSAVIALFQELEFGPSLVKKLPIPENAAIDPPPSSEGRLGGGKTSSALSVVKEGVDTNEGQLMLFDLPPVSSSSPPITVTSPAHGDYQAVTTEEALQAVVTALAAAPGFAFDTEATGVNPLQSDLVGISLAVQPGTAWYLPFGHRDQPQLPRQTIFQALRPFFADPHKPKYAHHAKFDIELLLQAGIGTHGLAFDTLLAARLLGKQQATLKDLAFSELRLPEPMLGIEDLIGRGAKQTTFDHVPIAQATPYAAADADMTLRLTEYLASQLAAEERLQRLFFDLELPLVPVLVAMEQAGIGLDVIALQRLRDHLEARLKALETAIYEDARQPFNINSSDQLSIVLFNRLGLPTDQVRRTARTKKYSLTAETLEQLRGTHPIIERILEYRQLTKLKSTYVDALPALINPRTGRVHTSYNQLGTATGRLSSTDPNLQNIPVRTEEGRAIRRAFVAAPGHVFIAADYSQIELRVLAHMTQDPNLLQAFHDGQDIHAATAATLFHVPLSAVDPHQRRLAKTVVFGVIYGISSFGLAQRTGLSRSEAQALIDALFARFPGLRDYIEQTLERGRRDGFVESLFGRRRQMPELTNANTQRRQAAEREAINAPIQATAADIMKLAMIKVAAALQEQRLQTRLLLQVHDELILEAPQAEADEAQRLVRAAMESACVLHVPLKVDVEVGPNWGDLTALT